mgnify:CR=1 FL=1
MSVLKMTARVSAALLALILLPGAPSPAAAQGASNILLSPNADYYGFDYDTNKDISLSACISACRNDARCQAFTYNKKSRWCFMKSDFGRSQPFAGTTAGRKTANQVDAATGTALPPPPDPAFISASMRKNANSLPGRLKKWYKPGRNGFNALKKSAFRNLQDKQNLQAAKTFGAALALATDDSAVLIAYGRAIMRQKDLTGKKGRLVREVAASSAILAYRAAPGPAVRADALNALAEALVAQKQWRMAMSAYKASLDISQNPRIAKTLAALRANHGFRVAKHQVDSDSANPRICLRFSQGLKADFDFSPYVRIDGQPPQALKLKGDRQLCLEGVSHAATYQLTLRQGLPSANDGEVLEKQVDLKVYVRDRAPAVRFTTKGFVLPRLGSQGIPVVSVNASEIEVKIYRVNERNLTNLLQKGSFLSQLTEYRAGSIGRDMGEQVWTGKLDVAQQRNKEVTTSFPVTEALPKRQPGVYVMLAKAKGGKTEEWDSQATQWFVISDIGLSSLSGSDGLHAFARSLSTAKPLQNVELRLMARNNSVLATARTDERGYVHFEAGLTRGKDGNAPALLLAEGPAGDTVLIDLGKPAFDLSDRGVSGRAAPPPMDAYLYTERGIYRPGSTVHAVTLLRDRKAMAISSVPLTYVFTRPDGIEYRRYKVEDGGLGAYGLDIPLPASSSRGTWRLAVHADPKKDALAETTILVEDFLPDRFEFDLTPKTAWLQPGAGNQIEISGRYLYGAPAGGLGLNGDLRIRAVRTLPGFEGYRFGLAGEDPVDDSRSLADLPVTDANGMASLSVDTGRLPVSTRPLEATLLVRMIEAGGRAVERSAVLPIRPTKTLIGIKPLFKGDELGEGETARFDVIAAAKDGKAAALSGLKWELVKLERSFQWYRQNGRWNYESVEYTKRVANGVLDITAEAPARIAAGIGWGNYRLEITGEGEGAPASSIKFSAGWYAAGADADTPDFLDIALDKKTYRPGDTARVNISPRHDGIALVQVVSDHLIAMKAVPVAKAGTRVEFPVDESWGGGAYVTATLYRPMDVAAARGPGRAIGLKWAGIDSAPRRLEIAMDLPQQFRPGAKLTIPLSLKGLAPGAEAFVTVAAVDVGILNLTRYQPPAPEGWFFGQRRLGMEFRDLYGRLIDGMLGVRGKIRSGSGDDDEASRMSMQGTPPAQKPVSLFSGIVRVGEGGKASISLDVPQFNGTLRMMAVAWSQARLGHAVRDLIVRDPIVVTASLPRFLAPGDTSRLLLNIVNTDGPAGPYTLTIGLPPHLTLEGAAASRPLQLAAGGSATVNIPVKALAIGSGDISIGLAHAGGTAVSQKLTLAVRAAQPLITRRQVLPLAGSGQLTLSIDSDMVAGLRPETASVSVSISRAGGLDLPGLLLGLDRYPYGCTEQTTSRALPLLYLADVAKEARLDAGKPIRERVAKAIDRVLTRQYYSGDFGLWSPGSDNLWLSAYVTDFLTRAREQKYDVPDKAFDKALRHLENSAAYNRKIKNGGRDIAYALYVLARNGRASLGDLRYFTDSRLDEFTSPLARAQLGAAFTYFGDTARAKSAFEAAMALLPTAKPDPLREDFGSSLRDVAAILALDAAISPPPLPVKSLTDLLKLRRAETPLTSTQEKAWMLLAAHGLLQSGEEIRLRLNGSARAGNLFARYRAAELDDAPVNIVNDGPGELEALVNVTGVPDRPLPAGGNALSISRSYYTLTGEKIDISAVKQTQRLITVLKVSESAPKRARLLVVDRLPAGLEIDNPAIMTSAKLKALSWLPKQSAAAHAEFRDDRFVAALERKPGKTGEFTLAYMVRAVSPGQYVLPPATVEDMYRPHVNARTATGRMVVMDTRP